MVDPTETRDDYASPRIRQHHLGSRETSIILRRCPRAKGNMYFDRGYSIWWIGERLQCLLHGEKKLWRMCNGYVVDLTVVELCIAMRENVAEPYDVSGVRNRFRNGGCHSVEVAHGLTANFQHTFHRRSGFLVRQLLL
jgi:hypothetical protein